jgi:hypothetical protein
LAAGSSTNIWANPQVDVRGSLLSYYEQATTSGASTAIQYSSTAYTETSGLTSLSNIPDSVTFSHPGPLLPGSEVTLPFAPYAPDAVVLNGLGYNLFTASHEPVPDPGWAFFSAAMYLYSSTLSEVTGGLSLELHGGDFDGFQAGFVPDPTQLPDIPLLTEAAFNILNNIDASQQTALQFTAAAPLGSAYGYTVFEYLSPVSLNYLTGGWLNPGEASFILQADLFTPGSQYGLYLQASHDVENNNYLTTNLLQFSVPEKSTSVPDGGASSVYLLATASLLAGLRKIRR